MELIAFASGKGGTGKTLLASCLGYALIKSGHRVLMIDADPATDGLSLFLLGKNGMRQINSFEAVNTFTGALLQFQQTGELKFEPRRIHRIGTNQQGDHGISYDALISGKYIYGDSYSPSERLVVPDLDQATFRKSVSTLFAAVRTSEKYDYVIIDTRGGFALESTDVCALADSFIVITEPDYTSFYQDRNLVRRISDAAKELSSKPLLRSMIVNKATEGEQTDENLDLQKMELSFRIELEKEFPIKLLDTHPVPVDVEALKAYKTQRIPYLAAPASLFSFATLSAYRDILQVVTARWSEEQVRSWNALIETVSGAIATRNKQISEEKARRQEMESQLSTLQGENHSLRERTEELKREMDRIEHRYERELQRSTTLLGRIDPLPPSAPAPAAAVTGQRTVTSPYAAASASLENPGSLPSRPLEAQAVSQASSAPSSAHGTVLAGKESLFSPTRIASMILVFLLLVSFSGYWWYQHSSTSSRLERVYNEGRPLALRISDLGELAQLGQRNFDGIKLAGANLSSIRLDGVSFRSATLSAASFKQCSLSNTDFSGANLARADFTGANLKGALLRNADLTGASLNSADLSGADLTGATVLPEQWKTSIVDGHTILPAVVSSVISSDAPYSDFPEPKKPNTRAFTGNTGPIRVAGNVQAAKIATMVQPVYPQLARESKVTGTVRLHAIIATDGTVRELNVVSGPPLLLQSALDAVRKWKYQKTLLNGRPVEVETTIDVLYSLNL
jgi:TonB family protein